MEKITLLHLRQIKFWNWTDINRHDRGGEMKPFGELVHQAVYKIRKTAVYRQSLDFPAKECRLT